MLNFSKNYNFMIFYKFLQYFLIQYLASKTLGLENKIFIKMINF